MSYEAKLREMGYTLHPVELNTGRYMLAVRTRESGLHIGPGLSLGWARSDWQGGIGCEHRTRL